MKENLGTQSLVDRSISLTPVQLHRAILIPLALLLVSTSDLQFALSAQQATSNKSSQKQASKQTAAAKNDLALDRKDLSGLQTFVNQFCADCHSSSDPAREFDIGALDFKTGSNHDNKKNKEIREDKADKFESEIWERMLRRIESRQMPPQDAERPSESQYLAIEKRLGEFLDRQAKRNPQWGSVGSIRRLTRFEYQNAVRDLLGIQIDAADFLPKDESSHGFDNITVNELSPTLLNRYLTAAQKISRAAIGGTGNGPTGVTIRLPADLTQADHVEGLPFGTRGGTLFQHQFPLTGTYEIEIKLTRDRDEKVEGLNKKHDLDFLLDRKRVQRFKLVPPKKKSGWDLDYTHSDSHLKLKFQADAGLHSVAVTFPKTTSALAETKRQPFDASYNRHRHPRKAPAIYQVSIVGPLAESKTGQTPSRKLIFDQIDVNEMSTASKEVQKDAAKLILGRIARRAYRRKIDPVDLETPLRFFSKASEQGGFEEGIQSALNVILVNPNFLFKIEREQELALSSSTKGSSSKSQESFPISDLELATRLSFFLWSSLPDEPLLDAALRGELSDDQVLAKQVRRMLKDPRSQSLVNNFASQWLYLRNLESISPELRLFPDFDDNLRQAFRRETELAFDNVLRNNRPVTELIQSDFTFLNQRLAKHYGISGVLGSHFRKVNLSPGDHRGGLLRHGSILMVTSYATRTSPTIRGNWILENIVGTPAPPPPPDVPNLKENTTLDFNSVRDRLAQHRANPACASCHDLMDPIGFALENFDAVGRWREFEGTLAIDSAGKMPDGTRIDSVDQLETAILKRPKLFVRTLSEKLMTYAVGRGVEPFDGPAIRKVVDRAWEDEFRFGTIVEAIVLSTPFRMWTREKNVTQ